SPTRARTWDLRINSPSLYQLSYRGTTCNYSGAAILGQTNDAQDVPSPAGIDRTDNTPSIPARSRMTLSWIPLSTSTSVYAVSPRDLLTMLWMLSPARAIVV